MVSPFAQTALVAAGGALGAVARFWVYQWTSAIARSVTVYATPCINLVGSFVLGFFVGASLGRDVSAEWRVFVIFGLCGGFTTFSTFSIEIVQQIADRQFGAAAVYALMSVATCVAGCALGIALGRATFGNA